MDEEFGPNLVTLISEETGEEIELEFIDALEYNGVVYRAFFPVVEEDAGDEEELLTRMEEYYSEFEQHGIDNLTVE